MRILGPATEAEMVHAFLRAEAYSKRFGTLVRQFLGGDLSLIAKNVDLESAYNKNLRRTALAGFRGYGANTLLFAGFPSDVEWKRVMFLREELAAMKYANAPAWSVLSGGTLLVSDGASAVDVVPSQVPEDAAENIRGIEKELQKGRTFEPLIIATESPESQHYVVEGHARITAYVRSGDAAEYEAIVGYSQQMSNWSWIG
jgi:hypothetical protein